MFFFIFSTSFPANPRQKSRVRFVISVCLPVGEWRVSILFLHAMTVMFDLGRSSVMYGGWHSLACLFPHVMLLKRRR